MVTAADAALVPVSIGDVQGSFFPHALRDDRFDIASTATPLFTQPFALINFNPITDTTGTQPYCTNVTGVNQDTFPLKEVVPQTDGSCTVVTAQGGPNNQYQAGLSFPAPNPDSFAASFRATLRVAQAGQLTINLGADDGWILAIAGSTGGQSAPMRVSGPLVNAPATGTFSGYPVQAAYNQKTKPGPQNALVTLNFPAAGDYPLELDYVECCRVHEQLIVADAAGRPIPATLAPGADIPKLDTETEHYLQGSTFGQTELNLYNSPVGFVNVTGWQFRDPNLRIDPTTPLTATPANLPFDLQLAMNSGATPQASLTNEDGTTLGLAVAQVSGAPLRAVAGQLTKNMLTYPAHSAVLPAPTLAVNAGGGAVGAYLADTYASGGSTATNAVAIDTGGLTNPAPQAVYQTERYGSFTYTLPGLTAGATYLVRLHFAELFDTDGPGRRLFNVSINSQTVLTNFDIYGTAGGFAKALVEEFRATASSGGNGGMITVQFSPPSQCVAPCRDTNAKVDGIDVLPFVPSIAVNAGGSAVGAFVADTYASGGNTNANATTVDTSGVTNPAPQAVYQTEHYGAFTYSIPNLTPGGTFTVRLHFAEIFDPNPGQRLFNIGINGQTVLANFSIYNAAGGFAKAVVKEFTAVASSGGVISVQFSPPTQCVAPCTDTNAKVSGIEVVPSGTDVALRATISGLDTRVIIANASDTGQFTYGFTVAPRVHLDQGMPNGVITVTQDIIRYASDGTSYVQQQPEYILEPAIVTDSSADPAAAVRTGPVSLALSGSSVVLQVDPAWLHDPSRVFPVQVDLPIATAHSVIQTGWFGTVTSCAPAVPAPLTQVVVGTSAGGCVYHGLTTFDLSSLPPDTTIQSAVLRLYTPSQMTQTGVQVYANDPNAAPAGGAAAWQMPSWTTTPATVAGPGSFPQTGSDGHWQSWNVTSLVSQWIQQSGTNTGVTLASPGTPVTFASPLGAGTDGPAVAPYLDIIYASPNQQAGASISAVRTRTVAGQVHRAHGPGIARLRLAAASPPPLINDGATTIYGVSGSFGQSSVCGSAKNSDGERVCLGGRLRVPRVGNVAGEPSLQGSLMRFSVTLSCTSATPGSDYWNNSSSPDNLGSPYNLMDDAYLNHLIPVVDFTAPNGSCAGYLGGSANASRWNQEVKDFLDNYLSGHANKLGGYTYFEIGNEPNGEDARYYSQEIDGTPNTSVYQGIFYQAAMGIYTALNTRGVSNFTILTGGMTSPTVSYAALCADPPRNPRLKTYNIDIAIAAINAAIITGGVPATNLGFAVHPYGYTTVENDKNPQRWKWWRSYFTRYPDNDSTLNRRRGPGVCRDLQAMLKLWTDPNSHSRTVKLQTARRLPVIFTEDNWADQPGYTTVPCSDITVGGCPGTYLVDLFTWLKDNKLAANPAQSQIRVLWFRGANSTSRPPAADALLGIYNSDGTNKPFTIRSSPIPALNRYCPYARQIATKYGSGKITAPDNTIERAYKQLRMDACY